MATTGDLVPRMYHTLAIYTTLSLCTLTITLMLWISLELGAKILPGGDLHISREHLPPLSIPR